MIQICVVSGASLRGVHVVDGAVFLVFLLYRAKTFWLDLYSITKIIPGMFVVDSLAILGYRQHLIL